MYIGAFASMLSRAILLALRIVLHRIEPFGLGGRFFGPDRYGPGYET